MTPAAPEPFEISVPQAVLDELIERLRRTRWPDQPTDDSWALGTDLGYARTLCEHWADSYDWRVIEAELNGWGSWCWEGLQFFRLEGGDERLPLVLLHGWPSGPPLYRKIVRPLQAAGHEIIVPSLPGFAWSDDPGRPLNVAAVSKRLRALVEVGLGHERYAIHGEDWGAIIATRMAFDSPETVAALHVGTPGVLPPAGNLGDPPMTDSEVAFAETARLWLRREGHHMVIQGLAPDAISVGLNDSPAGLAAYLVEKYRRWSDSAGNVESVFTKDELCDFLTMYWTTGTIASSMRLYWGERSARWRLGPDDRVEVPAAATAFPGDLMCPPREWTARVLADLRQWTEMPAGGHFGALEQPEALTDDILGFLAEVDA